MLNQDIPFICLRLTLIFGYGVISPMDIFFTCKNSLVGGRWSFSLNAPLIFLILSFGTCEKSFKPAAIFTEKPKSGSKVRSKCPKLNKNKNQPTYLSPINKNFELNSRSKKNQRWFCSSSTDFWFSLWRSDPIIGKSLLSILFYIIYL